MDEAIGEHSFVDRNDELITAGTRVTWNRHHGEVKEITHEDVVVTFDDFLGTQMYSMGNAERNIVKEH